MIDIDEENLPSVIVNLRRRRRGDPGARLRIEVEQRRLFEMLAESVRYLSKQESGSEVDLLVQIAAGEWIPADPDALDRAAVALKNYADKITELFRLFESADSAVIDALRSLTRRDQ